MAAVVIRKFLVTLFVGLLFQYFYHKTYDLLLAVNTMYALEIEQLRKTYSGGLEALKGISLNVTEGDFYALLGPNGAGKSTTIGVISSLVNKTSGKVKVFGYDIDQSLELAKQHLGLVPQEFNFNPYETVEQILLQQAGYYGVPRALAKERAQKIPNSA